MAIYLLAGYTSTLILTVIDNIINWLLVYESESFEPLNITFLHEAGKISTQ